ncbi:MAG: glycine--tRNA ligase, partial [Candidatus Woesearchaeota archaeon]
YDYGPYGAAIKRKIIELWRKQFVQKEEMLEIDGSVLMPEEVFISSGHLRSFADPITKCTKCSSTFRADTLLEEEGKLKLKEGASVEELTAALKKLGLLCKKCKGQLSDVFRSSLMVKAEVGIAKKSPLYLRPETCQSIFCDWARLLKTMRISLPKGIAQTGRAFRNEISPRQTLLRQVEFSQMEAEIFFDPEKINEFGRFEELENYELRLLRIGKKTVENVSCRDAVNKGLVSGKLIAYFLARLQQLYTSFGLPLHSMRFREIDKDERPFYSKETWDFEVETSLGWLELVANNYRTDYDLKGHAAGSGKDLSFVDEKGRKFIPHIWEVSAGLDRTFYAILEHAYKKEGERTLLTLAPKIAPLHAAVFPLLSNKPELITKAQTVYRKLLESGFEVVYDETGSIGKRYARMDEIGCPVCITIDFESLTAEDVTIRDRDTTKQKRIKIANLPNALASITSGTPFEKI